MSKRYGTEEVQALLAKPARIASLRTNSGDEFSGELDSQKDRAIVLLQNKNALVIVDNGTKYYVIASNSIESIEMVVEEVQGAKQEDTVSSIS